MLVVFVSLLSLTLELPLGSLVREACWSLLLRLCPGCWENVSHPNSTEIIKQKSNTSVTAAFSQECLVFSHCAVVCTVLQIS